MNQEQKALIKEMNQCKVRMFIYSDASNSIKVSIRQKKSLFVKANMLMIVREELLKRTKFEESLQSPEQKKAHEAVNNLIGLLADMLTVYLQDGLLSEDSLNSLIEEIRECARAEMAYASYIILAGSDFDETQVEESLGSFGDEGLEAFKEFKKSLELD